MSRPKGTRWKDSDKFIETCANEAGRAIRLAFADFMRKQTAFRKEWSEGIDIDLYVDNCYFYYKPTTDTITTFCTCEPSDNEPDIIVTAIFEDSV